MRRILLPLLLACALGAQAAHVGTVKETMTSGGYTYVLLDTAEGELWFAGPQTAAVAAGQKLSLDQAMPMHNFNARSLDRTFETIYFVNSLVLPGGQRFGDPHANVPEYKQMMASKNKPASGSIDKADYTVGELFFQPALLKGKTVSVRGQVTKYNGGILGSNWVHLMDGTGEPGRDDLVVTTQGKCSVGDLIVVKGTLETDKDLGAGYFFPVLIENAELTVEQSKSE